MRLVAESMAKRAASCSRRGGQRHYEPGQTVSRFRRSEASDGVSHPTRTHKHVLARTAMECFREVRQRRSTRGLVNLQTNLLRRCWRSGSSKRRRWMHLRNGAVLATSLPPAEFESQAFEQASELPNELSERPSSGQAMPATPEVSSGPIPQRPSDTHRDCANKHSG